MSTNRAVYIGRLQKIKPESGTLNRLNKQKNNAALLNLGFIFNTKPICYRNLALILTQALFLISILRFYCFKVAF